MPTITYHELSNYNAGTLVTKTFDLAGVTYEEHLEAIGDWLRGLTDATGQLCEEWIVCDYEDVPSKYVGTYSISKEYFVFQEFVSRSHLDEAAIRAGVELGIPLESIEEAYAGEYRNDVDFAQDMAESTESVQPDAVWPHTCIDWEHAARELMYDYTEDNGHYFSLNY